MVSDLSEADARELEVQIRRHYGTAVPLHGKVADAMPGWLAAGRNN